LSNEVREITDFSEWDAFVEESPQGTIFSLSKWLKLFDLPFNIYGVYQNNNLIGGMANFDKPAPLTPFQGILLKNNPEMKCVSQMSLSNMISKELLSYAPPEFYNHYTFPDIRPFKWAGWSCDIRYTYVVDLTDLEKLWNGLEKQTRYEITHTAKDYLCWLTPDSGYFDILYSETFKRKGLERPVDSDIIHKLCFNFNAGIFCSATADSVGSMAVIIEDSKRAYYILGASEEGHTSSLTLWTAFQNLAKYGVKEIDLVGANSESIALFKRGFAGKLLPYFGVKRA